MKYIEQAFSILPVFLIILVLSISIMNIIRSTSYMFDIARKREKREQQYYATEGLLNYGIAFIKEKWYAKKIIEPITIDVPWPPKNKNGYHGKLQINPIDSIIYIQSILIKNRASICMLSCTLMIKKDDDLLGNINKEWFIISNFQQNFF